MLLNTKRLRLREFVESDWQAILAYQSDPLYLRYNPWSQRTEEDVRAFVRWFLAWQEAQPRIKFQFAITFPGDDWVIGNCGIRMRNLEAQEADIGYEFDSRYWGRGYATEAALAMLAFGFGQLHLHRIWAHCITENVASARVLEKIGMQREGRLRENEWMKGRWWDTFVYAILDHEWNAQV